MIIQVSRVFLKKIYFSLMSLMCWLSTLTNTTNTIFNKTNSSTSQLPTEDCQMGRSGLTDLKTQGVLFFPRELPAGRPRVNFDGIAILFFG